VVNPAVAPSGFKGKIVVNGNGAVKFVPGGGVYFLACCGNTENAYYKFTGSPIGNIFGTTEGQISFTLQSRSSFAQRRTAGASERYSFSAQDSNGDQFYFLTQVVSGALVFRYMTQGSGQSYIVPAGMEDKLFGLGVPLTIQVKWDGTTASLWLNGALVQSMPYAQAAAQWNGTSKLCLGGIEHPGIGGHAVSDDTIRDFTVTAASSSGKGKSRLVSSGPALETTGQLTSESEARSPVLPLRPSIHWKALSCSDSPLSAERSLLCQATVDGSAPQDMELSIASASEQISVPSRVPIRKGDRVARFQAHIRPGISASAVRLRV
jgi:hypothetical protein